MRLSFQLPERFDLKYRSGDEQSNPDKPPARPVIIHRAILGSIERFMAIITEHFAGKWCVADRLRASRGRFTDGVLQAVLALAASSPCRPRRGALRKCLLATFIRHPAE